MIEIITKINDVWTLSRDRRQGKHRRQVEVEKKTKTVKTAVLDFLLCAPGLSAYLPV